MYILNVIYPITGIEISYYFVSENNAKKFAITLAAQYYEERGISVPTLAWYTSPKATLGNVEKFKSGGLLCYSILRMLEFEIYKMKIEDADDNLKTTIFNFDANDH